MTPEPTIENLQLLAMYFENLAERRRQQALSGDPRRRQDAIIEDVGRILASLTMPIAPRRDEEWTRIIQTRIDTDPAFRSTLRAFVHLIEAWLKSDRDVCANTAVDR